MELKLKFIRNYQLFIISSTMYISFEAIYSETNIKSYTKMIKHRLLTCIVKKHLFLLLYITM